MRFYSKIFSFTYIIISFTNISLVSSIRAINFLFVRSLHFPTTNFSLKAQPALMPKPSREGKTQTSKSTKVDHERLKETLKHLKEESERKSDTSTKEDREEEVNSWRVILYNDDIHNFMYVTESISKCVPQLALARAHLITLEAHKNGQAEIIRTWKAKAEQYCRDLQKFGLTVCTINDTRKS